MKFFLKDVRDLQPEDLVAPADGPLLFSSCVPCQPFTRQRTTRDRRDERTTLLNEIHPFVEAIRPDYVFVENVASLQKVDFQNGPLGRFVDLLDRLEYRHDSKILRAQDYGVPQCDGLRLEVAETSGDRQGQDSPKPVVARPAIQDAHGAANAAKRTARQGGAVAAENDYDMRAFISGCKMRSFAQPYPPIPPSSRQASRTRE